MQWFRWHHGTTADPKFRTISRKSGQPVHVVIAIWAAVLEYASESEERGSVVGLDAEDIASCLDLDAEAVVAVLSAMQGKVIEGDCLPSWDKRQPKREDNSADRVKAHRERKRTQANETERSETHTDAVKRTVTQCNAPDKNRTDSEKKSSVSNETDADKPRDPTEWVFRDGVAALKASGVPERQARSAIGRWRKTEKDTDIRRHIEAAQASEVIDPLPWITARIAAIAKQRDGPPTGERWAI